ncbi:class I SAM-dependent methyltransferase [Streptomyces triculaminicus]|uniref:class I SAM-dependent methyltransferase n=1 Tax=Streptomyces triculaminicus TaxID=2816232 RepID=UPI0037B2241A
MIDPEVLLYYNQGREQDRLRDARRSVEYHRTFDILRRHLPLAPAAVLDVGGGPGIYALALAAAGYDVALVDPVPLHVEQARQASAAAGRPLTAVETGDARALDWPDGSFDAVLLLGPLYHLVESRDRQRAWAEARRVLRPGGLVVAAGVCRYYTTWEMFSNGKMALPGAEDAVAAHVTTGQHRNPGRDFERLFTTAYFHAPRELTAEATGAGLRVRALLAVEGPAKLLPDLGQRMQADDTRGQILRALRRLEAEPSILGTSEHILVVASTTTERASR